jgi:sugar phosphate permease
MGNSGFQWKARHTVLAVLTATWIVSYLDRMVMAAAIPYIAKEFNLSPVEMGVVMSAFFAGYALCQIPGGILADVFGARKIMAGALLWWSAFTAFTGMATNLTILLPIRALFGVGEGLFPGGSMKGISTWFPVKERATANAIMLSSNPLGPAIAPLFVAAIMSAWGWRTVFLSLFLPGVLMAWLVWKYVTDAPEDSVHVTKAELAEIRSEEPTLAATKTKVTWVDVMKVGVVWQCFAIWFTFDITLWGFLSWLPSYLVKARGFTLVQMGIYASLPFFLGTLGLIVGGWASENWFKSSRKTPIILTQLAGALCLVLAYHAQGLQALLIYQTLAGGLLFTAMGAFWALPMIVVPKTVMGTAAGFINTAGQIAGFLAPMAVGWLVQRAGGSFGTAFLFLAGASVVSSVIAATVREPERVAAKLPA